MNRPIDRTIVISRSGTTTEAIRAIERMREEATLTTAITAVADSPVADLAGHTVALDFADERSVVQTRFATSALAFLRAHLGEDLTSAIADAERAVTMPLPHDPEAFDHFVFLGAGWSVGVANEAALKLRESAQAQHRDLPRDGIPPRPDQRGRPLEPGLDPRLPRSERGRGRCRHGRNCPRR